MQILQNKSKFHTEYGVLQLQCKLHYLVCSIHSKLDTLNLVMIIHWLLTQWNSFISFRQTVNLVSHKFYTVYLVQTEMSPDRSFFFFLTMTP